LELRISNFIRSDNGSEFIAKNVQKFIHDVGAKTTYIAPGSPWENGYIERFNGTLRDELLNCEAFYTLNEARVMIENYRKEYNKIRPHSSLNYMAPESFILYQIMNRNLVQKRGLDILCIIFVFYMLCHLQLIIVVKMTDLIFSKSYYFIVKICVIFQS
jgi:hypothetical protein